MVGDVGEMTVVRDEGMVGVAVPVATTEKGQLAESVEKVVATVQCQQCMILSSLFTLTFRRISLTRHERFVTLMLKPGNLSIITECTTDNCTEFSWN